MPSWHGSAECGRYAVTRHAERCQFGNGGRAAPRLVYATVILRAATFESFNPEPGTAANSGGPTALFDPTAGLAVGSGLTSAACGPQPKQEETTRVTKHTKTDGIQPRISQRGLRPQPNIE